jgi:hypothetical protein
MQNYRHDLIWRYGIGAAQVERTTSQIPEGGIRGNGCRGTKGSTHVSPGPNLDAMERFGRIERALCRLTEIHRTVLAIAYGDLGQAVTDRGVAGGNRWRAVAPLTARASKMGPEWAARQKPPRKRVRTPAEVQADEVKRDPMAGPAAARWARFILEKTRRTVEEVDHFEKMREQANAMISAAETAYVTAAGHVAHGERQIELARRNEQTMINARC